jgi:hypothetical protein
MCIFLRMTQAERIIGMFGGVTALSRALGHKHPTTVQGWKARGFIPSPQHNAVLTAGLENSVLITPGDFFDPPPSDKNNTQQQGPA